MRAASKGAALFFVNFIFTKGFEPKKKITWHKLLLNQSRWKLYWKNLQIVPSALFNFYVYLYS